MATSRLTSGPIRVVIIRFDDGGWAPYFCTDSSVEVRDILEATAARWAIEEHFHDTKEIWGAGQQQVRYVWSNIGCWHLNGWVYTLVELCCWDVEKPKLTDRSDRPWDNEDRRPSHADRRRSISREMLGKKFLPALPHSLDLRKLRTLFQDLIALAVGSPKVQRYNNSMPKTSDELSDVWTEQSSRTPARFCRARTFITKYRIVPVRNRLIVPHKSPAYASIATIAVAAIALA